jgi:3-deoxy-manno-octulosonate cytidylyltransferase (CMP-KDO synthetase)
MKVVAVIPARYSSSRFPAKVLFPIAGKPMIQRVWERARRAKNINHVVVAADDERVISAVRAFGGDAMLTSAEHRSGTERCAEVAGKIDADGIINVQGDEPLIHPESLGLVAAPFFDEDQVSMASLMHPLVHYHSYVNPNVVKVVCDDQQNAIYFSRCPIPCYRDFKPLLERWESGGSPPPPLRPVPMKHLGVYAYRSNFLQALVRMPRTDLEGAEMLEQLRVLAWGFRIRMVSTPHDSVGVDVPEDARVVEAIIREQGEDK